MADSTIAAEVIKYPAEKWLLDTYLVYSLYAIRDRALIDSSEGLKPVNRRILWTMFKGGIGPDSKHMKAARIAGNVMAYHPHGSSSVEDAMARMGQWFSLRIPLIDPYGSVGFTTGDAPAAARYWEARLTPAAMELVKEIKEGGVELGKNFDGELDEPKLLPVRWPVGIINGTQGIAVGYASNMLPHNPNEVMEAARALLKNPKLTIPELMKIMPGPDLPTGGELMGVDGVEEYLTTGSGTFVVRGRYNVEPMTRGKMKITFYELPFQVSAESVMTRISELQASGKFKEIATVKDLTDKKSGLRLVIETKAGTNHQMVLQQLFKETNLEEKFPVNATVLVDNRPVRVSMLDLLQGFLDLRRSVVTRKATVRLEKIGHRSHQLEAILAVLLDIDKAIAIIRHSDTADSARTKLMKDFKIDQEQADYILSMQLRRLTRQDTLAIKREQTELKQEAAKLQKLLKDPKVLTAAIDAELLETKKVISSPRRTVITRKTTDDLKNEQKVMATAAKEALKPSDVFVSFFADGRLIRSGAPFAYQSGKKPRFAPLKQQFQVRTDENLVLIDSQGIGHLIPVTYLAPELITDNKTAGITLERGVKLVGMAKEKGYGVALGTSNGLVKVAKAEWPNKDTFPVITLEGEDKLLGAYWLEDPKGYFYFASSSGSILVSPLEPLRPSGNTAKGIGGFNPDGATVIAFGTVTDLENSLFISQSTNSIKVTSGSEISPKGRGGKGVILQALPKEDKLVAVHGGLHPMIVATDIKTQLNLPAVSRRGAKGVGLPGAVTLGELSFDSSPKEGKA